MTTKITTISKATLSEVKQIKASCIEELVALMKSIKTEGGTILKKYVDAHCRLNNLVMEDLEDKEQLAILKDVKAEIRPKVCKSSGISEISFNTYASSWARENGYAVSVSHTPTQVKCSVCGKLGTWKKELNGKKVCKTCFDNAGAAETGSDNSDSGNAETIDSHITVSNDTMSITFTGDKEQDTDSIRSFILALLNDRDRSKLITPVLQELLKMKMIKVA